MENKAFNNNIANKENIEGNIFTRELISINIDNLLPIIFFI